MSVAELRRPSVPLAHVEYSCPHACPTSRCRAGSHGDSQWDSHSAVGQRRSSSAGVRAAGEKTTGAYATRNGTVPGMVDEDRNFSEGVAAGYDGASAGMFEPSVVTPAVPEEGSRCRS